MSKSYVLDASAVLDFAEDGPEASASNSYSKTLFYGAPGC
jgi:hypothetical protein